jgi:hypothetical protein
MPLTKHDLWTGDVLLKYTEGTGTNRMIQAGQAIISHNTSGGKSQWVHAAIHAGGGFLLEASGSGDLQYAPMKSGLVYEVHRYRNYDVAKMAASVAEGYVAAKNPGTGFGMYSKSGAFGSLFHNSNRGGGAQAAEASLWGSGPTPPDGGFYCSNFVVRAYIAAGQTFQPVVVPIDADYRWVSPKELQSRLNQSPDWTVQGQLLS